MNLKGSMAEPQGERRGDFWALASSQSLWNLLKAQQKRKVALPVPDTEVTGERKCVWPEREPLTWGTKGFQKRRPQSCVNVLSLEEMCVLSCAIYGMECADGKDPFWRCWNNNNGDNNAVLSLLAAQESSSIIKRRKSLSLLTRPTPLPIHRPRNNGAAHFIQHSNFRNKVEFKRCSKLKLHGI